MKQRVFILVFITILLLVFSLPLLAQPADEEEEGPIQARPNPLAWSKFSKITRFSNIQIFKGRGRGLIIDMTQIRGALEKTGISEPIMIHLVTKRGKMKLGSFKPTFLRRKRPGKAKMGNLKSKFYVRFNSIRSRRSVHFKGVDGESITGPATLIFKNKMGQTKASFRTNILLR